MAAYGGAVAIALARAGGHATLLAPGAALGALFLVVALRTGRALGLSLWLGGATYLAFLALAHHRIDAAAPLVAVLLLLSGELAAWSFEERLPLRAGSGLVWRRAGAVGLLALGGLAVATLVLTVTAGSAVRGLGWTIVGAVAAVGAAGAAIVLARR